MTPDEQVRRVFDGVHEEKQRVNGKRVPGADPGEPPAGRFDGFDDDLRGWGDVDYRQMGPAHVRNDRTKPITWIDASDIFCEHPEPEWIVPDLCIGPGRASCIGGYSGKGKTLVAQELALAVVSGTPVFGQFRTRQGLVRHVDKDLGHGTLRRYWRLARGRGMTTDDLDGKLQVSIFPAINLVSTHDDDWLDVCRGWDLVILDSLRTMLPGLDENDSRAQEHILRLAGFSAVAGTTFLLLHHFGKGNEKVSLESLRGSSGIGAGLGAVFAISLTGDETSPRLVTHVKAHGDASRPVHEPFCLELEDVPDGKIPSAYRMTYKTREQIDPPGGMGTKFEDLKARVASCVRSNPGIAGVSAIRPRLGARESDVRQAVKELETDGQIENRGSASRPAFYSSRGVNSDD